MCAMAAKLVKRFFFEARHCEVYGFFVCVSGKVAARHACHASELRKSLGVIPTFLRNFDEK